MLKIKAQYSDHIVWFDLVNLSKKSVSKILESGSPIQTYIEILRINKKWDDVKLLSDWLFCMGKAGFTTKLHVMKEEDDENT